MIKRLFLSIIILTSSVFYSIGQAATLLQPTPLDGVLYGEPGSTIGWGFMLSNDANYLVVTSATFESITSLGTFTDFISASNFFVVGPSPTASTTWSQSFDESLQTGIGAFTIDPGATIGSIANGQITLSYDLFSRSPLDSLFNPDTDTLSNGNLLMADASIAVVPLPVSALLFSSGLLGLFGLSTRKQTKYIGAESQVVKS